IERHWRRRCDSGLSNLTDVATLRITSAAKKWTKATALHLHRLAAQFTCFRLLAIFTRSLRLRRIAGAVGARGWLSIACCFAVETLQVWTKSSPLLDHARSVSLQAH